MGIETKTVGSWKLLGKATKKGFTHCLCTLCGREVDVRTTAITQGKSSKCQYCAKSANGKANIMDDFHVASSTVFQQYKRNAKARGLYFNLSRDEIKVFMAKDCAYCGMPPSNAVRTFSGRTKEDRVAFYNGIDRIDNTRGYELDNCVPCCFRCNWAKKDLTSEQFKAHIKRQYLHLFRKVTDKTPGELIDALVTADIKTWFAQEDALNDSLPEDKRVEAAERIHLYNNKRNKLMRSIDFLLDFQEDTVTEKTYNNFVEAKEKEGLK